MPTIELHQMGTLMVIYGLGFAAVFGIFTLLYRHAWRRRDGLSLDELEQFDTRAKIREYVLLTGIGLTSILLAVTVPNPAIAGWTYGVTPIVMTLHGVLSGRRRARLEKRLAG